MTLEVETISTSTSKKILLMVSLAFILLTPALGQLEFDRYSGYNDNYFSIPEYESQQEIATQFVAPFIFISVLLHFALSRALSFILANGESDPDWTDSLTAGTIPWVVKVDETRGPDTSKYAMILSITITASLIPTPYWGIITGIMGSIGLLTGFALLALFLYGFYNVAKALT